MSVIYKYNGRVITQIKSIDGVAVTALKSKNGVLMLDPDAWKFLSAAGITDRTIISAVNTLVLSLKTNSLWDLAYAIYPFVGGTESAHEYNLKDVTSYGIGFSGNVAHTANGVQGDGNDGYYDTNLNDNTVLAQDDFSMFVYLRTDEGKNGVGDLGTGLVSTNGTSINARNGSDQFATRAHCTTSNGIANGNSQGWFGISRTAAANYQRYIGTSETTQNQASTGKANTNILGMKGLTAFTSRQQAFAWIGEGVSTAQEATLKEINDTFQTELSRNV